MVAAVNSAHHDVGKLFSSHWAFRYNMVIEHNSNTTRMLVYLTAISQLACWHTRSV